MDHHSSLHTRDQILLPNMIKPKIYFKYFPLKMYQTIQHLSKRIWRTVLGQLSNHPS